MVSTVVTTVAFIKSKEFYLIEQKSKNSNHMHPLALNKNHDIAIAMYGSSTADPWWIVTFNLQNV